LFRNVVDRGGSSSTEIILRYLKGIEKKLGRPMTLLDMRKMKEDFLNGVSGVWDDSDDFSPPRHLPQTNLNTGFTAIIKNLYPSGARVTFATGMSHICMKLVKSPPP